MFSTVGQRIRSSVALSILLCAPAAAAGTDQPRVLLVDAAGDQRVVIAIGPVRTSTPSFNGSVSLPRGMMLHHASVRIVDAAGVVADVAAVEITLVANGSAAGLRPLLRLTAGQHAVDLPRPLGVRLHEGETVAVHGHLAGDAAAEVSVHVELSYEPLDGRVSRLGVTPVQLQLAARQDAVAGEWRADSDGRVMVLTGVPAGVAGELALVDVESGAVVWRDMLQAATGEAFGAHSDVIRVGAPIHAGRTYRLVLRLHTDAGDVTGRLVHALVVPVHTSVAVRS